MKGNSASVLFLVVAFQLQGCLPDKWMKDPDSLPYKVCAKPGCQGCTDEMRRKAGKTDEYLANLQKDEPSKPSKDPKDDVPREDTPIPAEQPDEDVPKKDTPIPSKQPEDVPIPVDDPKPNQYDIKPEVPKAPSVKPAVISEVHNDPQPEPTKERSSRPEKVVSEPIVTGPGAAVQTKKSSWSVRDTLILSLVSVLVFVGGVGLVTHFKPKFFQPPEPKSVPVVQPEPVVESKPVEGTPAGLGEVVSNHSKKIFVVMIPSLIFGLFVYIAFSIYVIYVKWLLT